MKSIIIILLSLFIFGCSKKEGSQEDITAPILIEGSTYITAAMNLQRAGAFVKSISPNSQLISISSSDVDYNGHSKIWRFEYRTATLTSEHLIKDPFSTLGIYSNENLQYIEVYP